MYGRGGMGWDGMGMVDCEYGEGVCVEGGGLIEWWR